MGNIYTVVGEDIFSFTPQWWDTDWPVRLVTVNLVGAMGGGLALQAKTLFPETVKDYTQHLRSGLLREGAVTFSLVDDLGWLCYFPTKRHWRNPSPLDLVLASTEALRESAEEDPFMGPLLIPPIGCGLGGLDWQVVRPLIEGIFENYPKDIYFLEEE